MQGFTLIELLVTLAIVSILMAIAVPRYSEYKAQAFDLRAATDLRSVAIAEEAYFVGSENYLSCQNSSCNALPGIAALSKGVSLQIQATTTGFLGTASHPLGSGKTFRWESDSGGMQ